MREVAAEEEHERSMGGCVRRQLLPLHGMSLSAWARWREEDERAKVLSCLGVWQWVMTALHGMITSCSMCM